jgi:uncharacterized membrane protein YdbT with pleckstrin-like domain
MSDQAKPKSNPIDLLKQLDGLVGKAVELTRVQVEAGEFHLTPVYQNLRGANAAIKARIFQLGDSATEAEALKALAAAEAERKANAEKTAAEKAAAAEAALAKQQAEEAAEKERLRILDVQRNGSARDRYLLKTDEEISAIITGLKINAPKGSNKGQLVNLILQTEGYAVTDEEIAAAAQGK